MVKRFRGHGMPFLPPLTPWALRPFGSSMRWRIRQSSVGLGPLCSDQNYPTGLFPAGYSAAVSRPTRRADYLQRDQATKEN